MSLIKVVHQILLEDYKVTKPNINQLFRSRLRIERIDGKYEIAALKIKWDGHTPLGEWIGVKTVLRKSQLPVAIAEILKNPEYFRFCKNCKKIEAKGHFHNDDVCHGCSERYLGIVH